MKSIIKILGIALVTFYSCNTPKEQYYVKEVTFPEGASLEEKLDMASRLVPTPQQLAWQQLELTAFIHFGINTFTGREWGDGSEDPAIFYPTDFDARQWARVLQESGFKMLILTAKHHDGFCLWPTATTTYSIASSPWKEGKGDIVREVREACEEFGLKFGVYLSPWDRNASCYGTPEYNTFFINQLTELLTNYGEVHEVWFDGANGEGPNGKKQEYDLQAYYEVIERLQPHAVTAIMGHDVRWVGNEKGLGRTTEWSATALSPRKYKYGVEQNGKLGISSMYPDLGSRELLAKADHLFWYPSEVDVSIRPGWFYHEEENQRVKSLQHLVDIYFQSVGYNSVLLLNIPPDRRGHIHEVDARRLKEFGNYVNQTFAHNLLKSGDKYKKIESGESQEYSLNPTQQFNVIAFQEDISKGQRVEKFTVEALDEGKWTEIATGTTIGYKRLFRIPSCQAEKIRLTILESRGCANICNAGLYFAESIGEDIQNLQLNEVPVTNWKVVSPKNGSTTAFDNNPETFWKSTDLSPLVIDMGESHTVKGFTYTPALIEEGGLVSKSAFYISENGKDWIQCDFSGEFGNIKNNPLPQFVRFESIYKGRYLKFEPLSEVDGKSFYTIAEIGILIK